MKKLFTLSFILFSFFAKADYWTQKADFGGAPRRGAVGFSIGNFGFIGTGQDASGTGYDGVMAGVTRKDFWEYHPEDSTAGINESEMYNVQFTISPNPAKDYIVISLSRFNRDYPLSGKENISITITDVAGKKVYEVQHQTSNAKRHTKIDVSRFSKGIYFVEVTNGKEKVVEKFVKE